MMKKLLTVKEASGILNCSEKTVRRLISDGELVCCKICGCLRIESKYLEIYINRQIFKFKVEHGGCKKYFDELLKDAPDLDEILRNPPEFIT